MKTTEALIRIEAKVQKLLEELEDIKMHVYALEEENEHLKAKFLRRDNFEGRENLIKLHDEGFHICPMHFGYRREGGDCLFCHAFISKRAESDE